MDKNNTSILVQNKKIRRILSLKLKIAVILTITVSFFFLFCFYFYKTNFLYFPFFFSLGWAGWEVLVQYKKQSQFNKWFRGSIIFYILVVIIETKFGQHFNVHYWDIIPENFIEVAFINAFSILSSTLGLFCGKNIWGKVWK